MPRGPRIHLRQSRKNWWTLSFKASRKGRRKWLQEFAHETVLFTETLMMLQARPGGRYVDCTLGGGGHTAGLLHKSGPDGTVLAIDQDPMALAFVREQLVEFPERLVLVQGNFRNVREIAQAHGFAGVDGVVFDLGVSSPQFDLAQRGFSYRLAGPLDMRMDPQQSLTAADLINTATEQELIRIFFEYGEERFARAIARVIVRTRTVHPIQGTVELADLVKSAIPAAARRSGPHPARRIFQALRIAVNDELGSLKAGLAGAFELLRPGGRLAVISFQSLEDRIVKQAMAQWARGCVCPPEFPICVCGKKPLGVGVTHRPVQPSSVELEHNSRSRSAKLRVIERLEESLV
ncbi:16S rRNA (cytosine(1402)-N(4))-methyltransferase RsmH [Alicyclobacillaceae bacterium I2511]|nr:16S rRNA (cytosine(1402)-N(4))-methyltransferase RsmH [Alicyclobacillaceae bacterium I2511]